MKDWQKAIANAGIMGGITFCSVVVSAGGCITVQSFTAAAVAFGITFFTLLSKYFKPPEGDVNDKDDKSISKEPEKSCDLVKVIGCLWV